MITLKQCTKRRAITADRRYQLLTMLLLMVVLLSAFPILKNKLNSSPLIALLYWGAVIIGITFFFAAIHVPGRIAQYGFVKSYAISGAVIYIAIRFVLGVMLKLIKATPYDMSPLGLLSNVGIFFSALIARELIRAYGIGTAWRTLKYKHVAIVVITLIFALTDISFTKLETAKDLESLTIFLVCDVGVALSQNVLLSVLGFYGGASSSICFLGILEAFEKGFPFLPELPWLATGAIGIAFPIIYAMAIAESCKIEIEEKRVEKESKRENAIYLTALFLSVMFAWFCVGVFTVYPSIVLTGSMEPKIYPGDVVLIKKMQKEEDINALIEGDVINFKRENINITHRIEEVIIDEAGNRSFRTKGDNNTSSDQELVRPNDVKGIVVNVVPKVGMPILVIKSQKEIPEGVIDYDERTNNAENQFDRTQNETEKK